MKNIFATIIIVLILGSFGSYLAIKGINNFFTNNELIFNQVVKVEIKAPIEIKKREPIIQKIVLDYPGEIDTDIKKFICETFGVYNCRIAIAVASVEGLNHPSDAFNVNTNGTIDVGYFRINSTHFKQLGCSLAEVITEKGNVLCAYSIWKQQRNWSAWVGFNNGNYLGKL